MNTGVQKLSALQALIAAVAFRATSPATAQTFSNIYSFTAMPNPGPPGLRGENSDGGNPYAGPIVSSNTLYGVTLGGGTSGTGTVFRLNTDGTDFTNLHSFASGFPPIPNKDGSQPRGRLVLSGNTLYGTAFSGGTSGIGAIFAVNTDGTGFTNLHSFAGVEGGVNADGANPFGGLVLSGDTLYGTASGGGSANARTVFAINTNGTGFVSLHSFTSSGDGTPYGALVISGNTLYGTASDLGGSGSGSLFAINTDGTGFTNLHVFAGANDGANPSDSLLLSGNILYGTAYSGGGSDAGTVFAINTDGTGFTNLHSFTGGAGGENPYNGLAILGNTLYGTVAQGGNFDEGAVFSLNTDGSAFTTLYSFTSLPAFESGTNADGALPVGGLVQSGKTLYGTAQFGGDWGSGTVFSLSMGPVSGPQLTIVLSGGHAILTWPASATGFVLQSTTNLGPSAVWTPVIPAPVVVNGQNTVSDPVSATQKFYELTQ